MAQQLLGELVHAVAGAAGVENVGEQHGVVEGRDADAVVRQHHPVILEVLRHLEHAVVFHERLHGRERVAHRDLVRQQVVPAEKVALALAAMGERDVAGLARAGGEREADDFGLHGVERGRLGVERDDAGLPGLRDPGLQPVEIAHGLVLRPVERRRLRRVAAARIEGGRRAGWRRGPGGAAGDRPAAGALLARRSARGRECRLAPGRPGRRAGGGERRVGVDGRASSP